MIPSIVKGNDFKIKVYVTSPQYESGETIQQDFDLSVCSDIKVSIMNRNEVISDIDWDLSDEVNNLIYIIINESLPIGSYGLEITGKTQEGSNWRFKAKQGELFNIIDATSGANLVGDLMDGYYDITASVGITQINNLKAGIDIDLSDYYNKEEVLNEINKAILNAKIDDAEIDLSNYFTKLETNNVIDEKIAHSKEGAEYYLKCIDSEIEIEIEKHKRNNQ